MQPVQALLEVAALAFADDCAGGLLLTCFWDAAADMLVDCHSAVG